MADSGSLWDHLPPNAPRIGALIVEIGRARRARSKSQSSAVDAGCLICAGGRAFEA
jgi:hypothetical protein